MKAYRQAKKAQKLQQLDIQTPAANNLQNALEINFLVILY